MNSPSKNPLALSLGDPAGIGPDIFLLSLEQIASISAKIYCDPEVLLQRAEPLKCPLQIKPNHFLEINGHQTSIQIIPVQAQAPNACGAPDPGNGPYILSCLKKAALDCLKGKCSALVTGPIHKASINQAGIPFSGHTEFLAELAQVPKVVMMLVAQNLRVALVTTHLPLQHVSAAITQDVLEQSIRVLHNDLNQKFEISKPRIVVCGLNPHAGENGFLGLEEIEIIQPTLEKLRQHQNFDLIGPVPADTAFTPFYLNQADAFLSMYHDQGLPVLKYAGFGHAVNVTLGLPFIRTSVDHGTAFDRAGTGNIDTGSFIAAIELALNLKSPS